MHIFQKTGYKFFYRSFTTNIQKLLPNLHFHFGKNKCYQIIHTFHFPMCTSYPTLIECRRRHTKNLFISHIFLLQKVRSRWWWRMGFIIILRIQKWEWDKAWWAMGASIMAEKCVRIFSGRLLGWFVGNLIWNLGSFGDGGMIDGRVKLINDDVLYTLRTNN